MSGTGQAAREDGGGPVFDLVAFDFDGTLADTLPWFDGIVDEICLRHGLRVPDAGARQAMRHRDAREIFRQLDLPLWKLPRVMNDVRDRMARAAPDIALFAGMAELLRTLHGRGVRLAVLSSNSAANVRRVIGEPLWALLAQAECGSDVFGKAGKLRRLMRREGLAPGRVLLVGDELRDIDAARQAGVRAGAVAWGYNHPDALRAHGPDRFFRSPADIAGFVLGGARTGGGQGMPTESHARDQDAGRARGTPR